MEDQEAASTSLADAHNTHDSDEPSLGMSMSKCVLCSKHLLLEDDVKLLECLHPACTHCIEAKLAGQVGFVDNTSTANTVHCPVCRLDSAAVIKNRFFAKFLKNQADTTSAGGNNDEAEEEKCTNCEERPIATSWCIDCKEFICDDCVYAHQKLKITKEHTIKPKEEIQLLGIVDSKESEDEEHLRCHIHPDEFLTVFCQTCDTLTCRDCQLTVHREHKYKFNHEVVAETRASLEVLLKEVSKKKDILKSVKQVFKKRQESISEKNTSLNEDIRQRFVRLIEALKAREKELLNRLNEVCDEKLAILNAKKEAVEQLANMTDHCINFVKFALDKGTNNEILYTKKWITNHLQRTKNRRAEIPNPDIPVRITLSVDRMNDLIKVISTIGSIYADDCPYPRPSNPRPATLPATEYSSNISSAPNQASVPSEVPIHHYNPMNNTLTLVQQMPRQMLISNPYANLQGQSDLTPHYAVQQQQQNHQQQQQQQQQQQRHQQQQQQYRRNSNNTELHH